MKEPKEKTVCVSQRAQTKGNGFRDGDLWGFVKPPLFELCSTPRQGCCIAVWLRTKSVAVVSVRTQRFIPHPEGRFSEPIKREAWEEPPVVPESLAGGVRRTLERLLRGLKVPAVLRL